MRARNVVLLLINGVAMLAGMLVWMPVGQAQDMEAEPNHPCAQAQNLGAIPLPYSLSGSLDSTPELPDVDFFRFVGTPGAPVRIDLEGLATGKGTLGDPFLGAFDSACNLIVMNDDYNSLNSRLTLTIPPDGVLIVGATLCCDGGFAGGGVGTYQLSVSTFAAIASISGRIVDAVTKQPLSGTEQSAFVRLLRCEDSVCVEVNSGPANSDGTFLFNRDSAGQLLDPASYQVIATANEYEPGQTDPMEVFEGENRNLGDIPLQPFPVRFSDIKPCADVPAGGGKCRYSVRITNRLGTRLTGAAWSIVAASGTGSLADFTQFQTDRPKKLQLGSLQSQVVHFSFEVPDTVRAGAYICATVFFGDDRREPQFNTVGQSALFCVFKSAGPALEVMPKKDAHKVMRHLDGRRVVPPKRHPR